MAARAKHDHKAVWHKLTAHFAPLIEDAGYAPHPRFPFSYDKYNAAYQADFIAPAAADGIRMASLAYGPNEKCWYLTGLFTPCDTASTILDWITEKGWPDAYFDLPSRQTDLKFSSGWQLWRSCTRRVKCESATGKPKKLDWPLTRAALALPDFFAELNRPYDPGRDQLFGGKS
ncbi:hypothetical protein ACSBLW_08990 [Thioclava sp. FR2]|uniref:hypothetical protein n=1 Tax=Thioclava sp. FR2 TaxID=3445780 RepID=UPI003EBE59FD